jgi:hypothetical protein
MIVSRAETIVWQNFLGRHITELPWSLDKAHGDSFASWETLRVGVSVAAAFEFLGPNHFTCA